MFVWVEVCWVDYVGYVVFDVGLGFYVGGVGLRVWRVWVWRCMIGVCC